MTTDDDERGQRWVNFVGAGGEFRVASFLSQRGYIPSVPLVDDGYDFFVFDPVNDKFSKVQVKASRAKLKDRKKTKRPKLHKGQPWADKEYWHHQVSVRCDLVDKDVGDLFFVFLLLVPNCSEEETVRVTLPQQALRELVKDKRPKRKRSSEGTELELYNLPLVVFPDESPTRVHMFGAKPSNPNLQGRLDEEGLGKVWPLLDLSKKKVEASDPVPEDDKDDLEEEEEVDEDSEDVDGGGKG